MGSVSQIGWEWYSRLSKQASVTLVTHVRNREKLADAGAPLAGSEVIYIDTEWFAGPVYRLASRLFPGNQHAVFLLSSIDFFLYDRVALKQLRRRKGDWDLVHAVTPVSPIAATRLYQLGLPLIVGPWNGGMPSSDAFPEMVRQDPPWVYKIRAAGRVIDRVLGCTRNATLILTATQSTDRALHVGVRTLRMLENGVDLGEFHPAPQRHSSSSPLRILFVGRLLPVKGIGMLLDAVHAVRSDIPVNLLIVGEGPLREDLQAEVAGKGLSGIVTFAGEKTLSEVAELMREADVFCLPSVRESGGAVLLEAMASGLPVIAVDRGGPAELVDEYVGRKLSAEGPEQLVRDLIAALRDIAAYPEEWRERGLEGRRRAERLYSWDSKISNALKIYADVMHREPPVFGSTAQEIRAVSETQANTPQLPDSVDTAQEDHAATVKESLSNNVMVDMAARVGYLVSRFFIPPFVLAHVTLEAYGLWSAAFIVVSYVGLSTMGISNVYIKFVAEYTARREYLKANQLLSTGLCLTVPFCLAVFGIFYLLWPHIVQWLQIAPSLQGDAREVVLSVVAIFLASLSLGAFHDAAVGAQKTAEVQLRWVACYVVETILIFVLVGMGRGIRGLSEAFLVRTALDLGLCLIMAVRLMPWMRISPALVTKEALRTLFAFGAVVQIQGLLSVALNSIERAIAAPVVGLAGTGLLDIGKKLPGMAGSVPIAFASSFTPAASYLHGGLEGSEEQREAVRKLYLKGARYMNLVSAWFCGLLVAAPGPIIDIWTGKHYAGAAYLVVIFAISTQAHLLTGPGTSILKGIGRPREEFFYLIPNVLALLITVPLSRYIQGEWSVLGIGTGVAAATLISASVFVWHANRLVLVSFRQYLKSVIWPGIVPYIVGLPFAPLAAYAESHFERWAAAGWIALIGLFYSLVLAFVVDRFIWETGERFWIHETIGARLNRFRASKPLVQQEDTV